jgi:hypothetical protein
MFAIAMLGCGGSGPFGYSSDSIGWVAGADRTYTYEQWQATGERDVVLDQASRDFACPTSQLAVARPDGRAYVVTGCGHRGAFVTAGAGAPNVVTTYMRAVNVLAPVAPPPTPVGAVDDAALQTHSSWYIAQRWVRLAAQAAVDLGCPADQLTPDFIPQGRAPDLPVVEGCGQRATYLSEQDPRQFRLSSLVAMEAGALP